MTVKLTFTRSTSIMSWITKARSFLPRLKRVLIFFQNLKSLCKIWNEGFTVFSMEHSSIHQPLGLDVQSRLLSHNVSLEVIFFLTNQQLFCRKQNVKKCCWDECQNCKYELKLFVFSTLQQQSVVVKTLTHQLLPTVTLFLLWSFVYVTNKFFLS